MPNRLAEEKSLYLKQHAENPVDWYPWGEEALSKAQAEDKPLLISIGYSSCHWCHVMAHESFENDYIAKLMNEHFVCVKVDREERPDVDRIYMDTVQMLNGHGGWPLNVFCLPDGRPFAGGTYFPPEDRGQGVVPWPQILMRVADYYRRERDQLVENAESIVKNLAADNNVRSPANDTLNQQQLIDAAHAICKSHDDEMGGFGQAPKFPPSMTLNFLLEMRGTAAIDERDPSFARRIDRVVNTTLSGMAHGGLFDQIGGGFARYSVDKYWLIPHFEKMLYDNGLLLDIYTKGWLRYRWPLYRAVVEETVDWLMRDMRAPNGGFYSSFDADSEGEEGKFYVWTPQQVAEVLGEEDARVFCETYYISEKGNFEHGASNPALAVPDFDKRQALRPMREKLLQARSRRIPPGKDTKQLTAWNSLLIRGLAEAGFYLGRKEWLAAAKLAADWIWDALRYDENRLHAVFYHGEARFNGYLDDYAFYAEALLGIAAKIDWLEPGAGSIYAERARAIIDAALEHFKDHAGEPGWFFTSDDHEKLVSRPKEWWDNAIPAGNSSLIHACSCLYALTGEPRYREPLQALRQAYPFYAERAPGGISHALAGYAGDAVGIAVIKIKDRDDLDPVQEALAQKPWRRTFLAVANDALQPAGYQLCVGAQCLEPASDIQDIVPFL